MGLQGLVTPPHVESQSVSWYTKCIWTMLWAIPISNRGYLRCECCSVLVVLDNINNLKQNNLIISF